MQYVVTDKVFNKLRAKRDDMRHGEGESQELDWPTAKRVCLKFALKCRTRHCVNRSLFVMRKRREDPQTFVARALKDRREGERELGYCANPECCATALAKTRKLVLEDVLEQLSPQERARLDVPTRDSRRRREMTLMDLRDQCNAVEAK